MAMKSCKECHKEISSSAKVCPSCGAKQGMGCLKIGLIIFGGFMLLSVIGSIINAGKKTAGSTSSNTSSAAPTAEPVAATSQVIQAKIGQEVSVGHFVYVVKGVSFKKRVGNDFINKTADGIFLIANMQIKNVSNESRTLDSSMFKVKDANGVIYEYSTDASTTMAMSGGKSMFLKQCQPNIPTSGELIFEVPDKAASYTLEVTGGFATSDSADIQLK